MWNGQKHRVGSESGPEPQSSLASALGGEFCPDNVKPRRKGLKQQQPVFRTVLTDFKFDGSDGGMVGSCEVQAWAGEEAQAPPKAWCCPWQPQRRDLRSISKFKASCDRTSSHEFLIGILI
jgi:hypothetical protein